MSRHPIKICTVLAGAVGVTLLAACSSSSDENNGNTRITSLSDSVGSLENATQIGFLSVAEDSEFREIYTLSTFFQAPTNPQDNLVVTELATSADTCSVEADEPELPLFEDQLLNNYVSVSAGEILTLSSLHGTYSELTRTEVQDGLAYLALAEIPYPSPASLTATVPGDDFSAANITIAKPPVVQGLSISTNDTDSNIIQPGATIRWTPADDTDTLVVVYFTSARDVFDPSTSFSASCLLIDDGEFTVPTNLFDQTNAIAGGQGEIVFDGVGRLRVAVSRQGTDVWVAVYSTDSNPEIN